MPEQRAKAKKAKAARKQATLAEVVHSVCDGVDDAEEQRKKLSVALKKRPEFHVDVWEEGISRLVYHFRHDLRTAVKQNRCPRGTAGLVSAGAVMEMSFGDRWVFDKGRHLGDMPRDDLPPYIERALREARGHNRNAEFLQSVYDAIPARGKVRDHLSDAKLRAMWEATADD